MIEQLPQPDPRGWLALRGLPPDLQAAEDARAEADQRYARETGRRTFSRLASGAERQLLQYLGYTLPKTELRTVVSFVTASLRNRRWPQLEQGAQQ